MTNLRSENTLPPRQELHLLLASRGNPDHGQDPDQPPFGAPDDQLVVVPGGWDNPDTALAAARKLAEAFRDDYGLGGGNWVGGDLWANGAHQGHLSYNGRFHPGEAGPLVRDGEFVFGDLPAARRPTTPADRAEGWKDLLLAAVEASTDEDWYHVFAIRPDLADRLRTVMDRLAPDVNKEAWQQAVGNDLNVVIAEGLADDDEYTQGYRDAVESLTLALHEHVAPDVLRESVLTTLDAYANNAPERDDARPTPGR